MAMSYALDSDFRVSGSGQCSGIQAPVLDGS